MWTKIIKSDTCNRYVAELVCCNSQVCSMSIVNPRSCGSRAMYEKTTTHRPNHGEWLNDNMHFARLQNMSSNSSDNICSMTTMQLQAQRENSEITS